MKVALLNPAPPTYGGLSAETCCIGPAGYPPYNSRLGGLASILGDAGRKFHYVSDIGEVPTDADWVFTLLIPGYERFIASMMKWVKCKKAAFCVPPELAAATEYGASFDSLIGADYIAAAGKLLGIRKVDQYPQVKPHSLPPKPFIPWLNISDGDCPSGCTYCSYSRKGPKEWRSPENTVKSLEVMYAPASKVVRCPVYLACPEIDLNKVWLRKFVALKNKSSVADIQIITDCRADWMDDEVLELLVEAKTHEVIAALETPNKEILKVVDRRMDPLKYAAGYKKLRAAGIKVNCPVMFNLDDREDPEKVAAFCRAYEIVPNPGIMKYYASSRDWAKLKEWDMICEWPEPAEPLRTRKGVDVALAKLAKFKELMGLDHNG